MKSLRRDRREGCCRVNHNMATLPMALRLRGGTWGKAFSYLFNTLLFTIISEYTHNATRDHYRFDWELVSCTMQHWLSYADPLSIILSMT